MPERKKAALMNKLINLHKEELLDEKELKLFRMLLTQERAKGTLNMANTFTLNQMEYDECELDCYVRSKDMPPVYGLKYDTKCKYRFDADAGRIGVGHGKGRYIVYAPMVVPQEHQLNHKQALDKIEGREIDFTKVPAEKTLIRRFAFASSEFDKWFGYEDEELLGNKAKDEIDYEF
jgi:hypothetical protein